MLMIVIFLNKGKENCEKKIKQKTSLGFVGVDDLNDFFFFFFFGKNLLLQKILAAPTKLFFFYFVFFL